jgi:Major Facilitator Superfamily
MQKRKENLFSAAGFRLEKILPVDVKRATIVAFFAWVFAVYDFILFGTLLPEIGRHYGWDAAAQAEIATLVAVGTAVIAFAIGPVLDRVGRRAGLLWTVAGAALCSGLTVVGGAMGQWPLVLIRSLSGLGYAEETVNATYLNELYAAANDPKLNKRKGFIYSLVQGGWPIGALIASALTAVLLPRIGWQGCFIFATFPAIVIFFMTRRLKESPQFMLHFPTAIRGTGSSIVHAMGPIGAILAGIGVTAMLNHGSDWLHAALWFGALPCLLSGVLVMCAKHVKPEDIH